MSTLYLFLKSLVAGYTRRDGTVVAPHSDKRTKRTKPQPGQLALFEDEKKPIPPTPLKGLDPVKATPDLFEAPEHKPDNKQHPAGVYASLDAFQDDTQPFGAVAHFAAAIAGFGRDPSTHGKTLGQVLEAMKPAVSRQWALDKELSDPAFARAHRDAFGEAWRIAADVKQLAEDNPKLDIMNKVRGPWVLDLINRLAAGEKHLNMANYVSDSKPYAKVKAKTATKTDTPNYDTMIKIAADSIEQLRASDVDRVLEQNDTKHRAGLAAYISEKRPDLAGDVSDVMEELDAKPLAKSIIFLKPKK